MNFGNVFITLFTSAAVLFSSIVYGQVEIPEKLGIKSNDVKEAYLNYIMTFETCHNKKIRKNNPLPISDWLLSLSKEKQVNVTVYLHSLAGYNCILGKQNSLIEELNKNNEMKALKILEQEGWFKAPIYGEYAKKDDIKKIELTDEDKEALNLLIERNYLPFDIIRMHDLYQKLNVEN